MSSLPYITTRFNPQRRKSIPVQVGNVTIGGDSHVVIQSMVTTLTKDIDATVEQTLELANAGCEIVRITAPTAADAACLEHIVKKVRDAGCNVPISADIHFQPRAALEAAKWVEKVRINPGNFVDKGVLYLKDWSESDWNQAVQRVSDEFSPLVLACKERNVAIRIGTNHGSLSGRMIWKYGDSIEGMVESALEYLRVCVAHDFHNVIFSMKASNAKVVIEAYRMLAARLDAEFKAYPFHVGVTEAGEGEDGRLKSAVGIGALLLDGIGDTIRVSLTEHPVQEIPVARELVRVCEAARNAQGQAIPEINWEHNSFNYSRRISDSLDIDGLKTGGTESVKVGLPPAQIVTALAPERPLEWIYGQEKSKFFATVPFVVQNHPQVQVITDIANIESQILAQSAPVLWMIEHPRRVSANRFLAATLAKLGRKDPILLSVTCEDNSADRMLVAAELGSLLCDGLGDSLLLDVAGQFSASLNLSYDILQATGLRRTKTEFVSCPSCGRTLFDLEEVTAKIKSKTGHLKDLSIAIMGCIVNGPGEMADADFGYVGGAPNKISLYVGKECVEKNIPEAQALDSLISLIKQHGRWVEPV